MRSLWLAAWLCWLGIGAVSANEIEVERLQAGGYALMMRHAEAPGSGDPDGFQLGDCATQRNLSEAGREQAREIGRLLRADGVTRVRVFSSQWCRCLETAELLGFGEPQTLPALDSFFDNPQEGEARTAALRAFLAEQDVMGETTILVTHQVNITAMTGRGVAAGAIEIIDLDGSLEPEHVGTIAPP